MIYAIFSLNYIYYFIIFRSRAIIVWLQKKW
nr:MAG TPA: hypothetical protein [Caudoviricetes sp.]